MHSEKYQVQLANGLDSNDYLSDQAMERGLETLRNLVSTTAEFTPDNFKIVATYTLRQAKNAEKFLRKAAKVFPFDIEIITGHEEARLIYQGVAYYTDPTKDILVVDIGGGSTECVIGKNFKTRAVSSTNIGCVSFQQAYFPTGEITEEAFEQAIVDAKIELEAVGNRYKKMGWQLAYGTSGTIKAISRLISNSEEDLRPFNLKALNKLEETVNRFWSRR